MKILIKIIFFLPWFCIMGFLTAIYSPVYFYVAFDSYLPCEANYKFKQLKITYPWVWWNNLLFL